MNTNELLNPASLTTLVGASFAVALVGNVAQYVFGWSPRWLGLAVAMVLAFALLLQVGSTGPIDWLVSFFRGLQIYATAVGITSVTGQEPPTERTERGWTESVPAARALWPRWF